MIPLYKSDDEYLVALREDLPDEDSIVEDCLIIKVHIDGTFYREPWSGQLMLKHAGGDDYEPVLFNERTMVQKNFLLILVMSCCSK